MSPVPADRQLYREGDVIHDLTSASRFGIVCYVHPQHSDSFETEWEYTVDWATLPVSTSTIMKQSEIELAFRQ